MNLQEFIARVACGEVAERGNAGAGVYIILNTSSARVYIGSTKNFAKRFTQHRLALRAGKHHNSRLQADWLAFGEAAFRLVEFMELAEADAGSAERDLIRATLGDACYNWSVNGSPGRPELPASERQVVRSIRLRRAEWETIKTMGGGKWLRELVANSPVP